MPRVGYPHEHTEVARVADGSYIFDGEADPDAELARIRSKFAAYAEQAHCPHRVRIPPSRIRVSPLKSSLGSHLVSASATPRWTSFANLRQRREVGVTQLSFTLSADVVEAIAERAAEIVLERLHANRDLSPWLSGAAAAGEYLGWPRERVYKRVPRAPA